MEAKKFDAALAVIKSLPEKGPYRPSNETLLLFYGYYKQATQGNNTQSAPWAFDIVAKAKWDAWKKYENLSKEQAMQGYVDTLLKVIEDIPESEKQSLVGLDKKNVLQEFLSLVNEPLELNSDNIIPETDEADPQIDECTSIKSDDEYWDADRVDMEKTVIEVNDVAEVDQASNSQTGPDTSMEVSATVVDSDKSMPETKDVDTCKIGDDISLSEFQGMFNTALGDLQKDISNVIVAVTRLEEALKVPAERTDKPNQSLAAAKRAVEVSTDFKRFLRWNWKWALFLVIWPFITQFIIGKMRSKKS